MTRKGQFELVTTSFNNQFELVTASFNNKEEAVQFEHLLLTFTVKTSLNQFQQPVWAITASFNNKEEPVHSQNQFEPRGTGLS